MLLLKRYIGKEGKSVNDQRNPLIVAIWIGKSWNILIILLWKLKKNPRRLITNRWRVMNLYNCLNMKNILFWIKLSVTRT